METGITRKIMAYPASPRGSRWAWITISRYPGVAMALSLATPAERAVRIQGVAPIRPGIPVWALGPVGEPRRLILPVPEGLDLDAEDLARIWIWATEGAK